MDKKIKTQEELKETLDVSRATIARQIKILIENNKIRRCGSTKAGYWEVL